jgi:hypothetical protein
MKLRWQVSANPAAQLGVGRSLTQHVLPAPQSLTKSVVAVRWNSNCISAALFDEIGIQMDIDTFTCLSLRLNLETALVVGTTRS